MKVKDESFLRSLTALLRETFKNGSDQNERLWYTTVPSITQIWTRRPQWRRRHKNRKKSKYYRFPLPSINCRIDENVLWDTLKPLEGRPCSRTSTSPYETCSSRPFVTESDLSCDDDAGRNHEVLGWPSDQRSQTFRRKSSICKTRSDSRLLTARGTQLEGPIRSQKRLGVRNSANSQNTVGTLSSLEANKSARLSIGRELLSDFSVPKRRVTFSNYVSENSATDTRSQYSGTANDNDPREAAWWEHSNDRLTDVGDDFSLRADLSCLFSSAIFDESKSSFFSLTASLNSEKSKKSVATLDEQCNECVFYVNPSYSNESSCELAPIIYAIDDLAEPEEIVIGNDRRLDKVLAKTNESRTAMNVEKISSRLVPETGIFREINTDSRCRCSIEYIDIRLKDISSAVKEVSIGRDFDASGNYVHKNTSDFILLNIDGSLTPLDESLRNRTEDPKSRINEMSDFIPLSEQSNDHSNAEASGKKAESQRVKDDVNVSKRVAPDEEIFREINTDPTYRGSVECINIQLEDISSAVEEVSGRSGNNEVERRHCNLSKNHVSTDTGSLNADRLLTPVAESLENRVNDAKLHFLQQPKNLIDAAFLLQELSRVGAQTFGNHIADATVGNIPRIRETNVPRDCRKADNVNSLRIDAETCGELETILIEVENLGGSFEENVVLKKSSSKRVHNYLEPCESLVVNLAEIGDDPKLVSSSASNFHDEYANCSGIGKCCLICGRKKIDNPRYLRPVCQVRGVTPTSRLENDPWISVLNKVVNHGNDKNPANGTTKNLNTRDDQRSTEESSKDSDSCVPKNFTNESSHLPLNESGSIIQVEEDCFGVKITGAENSSPSKATVVSNIQSSRDQSTNYSSDPERSSSTSFGFATFRGPRTQSAKTYFMRESVRTAEGTANRLLCVISESDSLTAIPPFLSKKPPDWFGHHRMHTKKKSRR